MHTKPDVLAFLQELLQRISAKSPKFFKVIQVVTLALGLITGIPEFLQQINVALPPEIDVLASKVIAGAAWGAWFISLLTVQRTASVTTTTEKTLPFTAKKEDDPKVNTDAKPGL